MGPLAAVVVLGLVSVGSAWSAALDVEALERLKKRSETPAKPQAQPEEVCDLAPRPAPPAVKPVRRKRTILRTFPQVAVSVQGVGG